jgi:hypothetical protein
MKGLLVSVYRKGGKGVFDGDTTNGGISSKHDRFVLVGDEVAEVFSPTEHTPAIRLIKRKAAGQTFWIAAPLDANVSEFGAGSPYSFGGNFLYTSDSRFPALHPIMIFDRLE